MALATKWRPVFRLLRNSKAVPKNGVVLVATGYPVEIRCQCFGGRMVTTMGKTKGDDESKELEKDETPDARAIPNSQPRHTPTRDTSMKPIKRPKDIPRLFAEKTPGKLALVKSLLPYQIRGVDRKMQVKTNQSMAAQLYLLEASGDQSKIYKRSLHWRTVLAKMAASTPMRRAWIADNMRFKVGKLIAIELVEGVDHSIWEIYSRTGCSIDLYPTNGKRINFEKGETSDATVVLSGDSYATCLAVRELRLLAARLASRNPGLETDWEVNLLTQEEYGKVKLNLNSRHTSAFSERERRLPSLSGQHDISRGIEEDVLEPTGWSEKNLVWYISRLAHANLSQRQTFERYRSPFERDAIRLNLMHKTFVALESRGSASLLAFKIAIYSVLLSGPRFRPHLRQFLGELIELGLTPTTQIFNIMLEDAAKHKDLDKFDHILKLMDSYECSPDILSWYYMLRMVEEERAKRHVIKVMHSVGLLYDARALRLIAKGMVFFDTYRVLHNFEKYSDKATEFVQVPFTETPTEADLSNPTVDKAADQLSANTSITQMSPTKLPNLTSDALLLFQPSQSTNTSFNAASFIDHLNHLYGSNWDSIAAVRSIVNVMALSNRFDAITSFLDALAPFHKKDPFLYPLITSRARTALAWDAAMDTLTLMHKEQLTPDAITLTQLYMLARSLKLPNSQALIWIYACLHDQTTFSIRASASFDLRYPGQAAGPSWTPLGPRRTFTIPPLIPSEVHSAFIAATDNSLTSIKPSTAMATSTTQPSKILSARKLGATLLNLIRSISITPDGTQRLIPATTLEDLIRMGYVHDKKIMATTDIDDVVPPGPSSATGPTMTVKLVCPYQGTQNITKTLTIQCQLKRGIREEGWQRIRQREAEDETKELEKAASRRRRKIAIM